MSKNKLILLCFFYATMSIFAQDFNCKERLPSNINNYAPVIVPVISLDNKFLYFDRKEYPLNTGGYKDVDDIWFSEKTGDNQWSNPKKLDEPINSKLPNVLFSLSPDGKKALLYTDYYIKSLKLSGFVIADRKNNEFTNLKPVKIKHFYNDSKNFYGFLSADNKTLLLSIKSNDCLGREDLYVSFFDDKSQIWTEPKNLGNIINSADDEISPFLAFDGKTLYFSSNRENGYGNYDLFMSRRLDNTWQHWTEPKNLGKPINTQSKENGIYLTALSDSAYIISSEVKIVQNDNINRPIDSIALRSGIYKICIPKSLQPEPYIILKGNINNEKHKSIKQKVVFRVKDNEKSFDYSTNDGTFLFILNSNKDYTIKVSSADFENSEFQINTRNLKESEFITQNMSLKKNIKNNFTFPIIYFDYNKSNLSKSNKQLLSDAIKNIVNYKSLRFKIIGHTDKSGTEKYNYSLSLKRAESTKKYLILLGINPINISIEGKGETEQISSLADKNRRVEILIIKR